MDSICENSGLLDIFSSVNIEIGETILRASKQFLQVVIKVFH